MGSCSHGRGTGARVTTEQRTVIAKLLWRSVERLVPSTRRADLAQLQTAIEATYDDHAEACAVVGYRDGRAEVEQQVDQVREDAFRAGMLAVRKRSDYRDLDDIQDPEELRSTH